MTNATTLFSNLGSDKIRNWKYIEQNRIRNENKQNAKWVNHNAWWAFKSNQHIY